MIIKIIYDPLNGQAVADAQVEDFVCNYIRAYKSSSYQSLRIVVGTETMFNRFRLAVAQQEIDSVDVEFYFDQHKLNVTAYGGIQETSTILVNQLILDNMFKIALSFDRLDQL